MRHVLQCLLCLVVVLAIFWALAVTVAGIRG